MASLWEWFPGGILPPGCSAPACACFVLWPAASDHTAKDVEYRLPSAVHSAAGPFSSRFGRRRLRASPARCGGHFPPVMVAHRSGALHSSFLADFLLGMKGYGSSLLTHSSHFSLPVRPP